jgi:hypothetical protein
VRTPGGAIAAGAAHTDRRGESFLVGVVHGVAGSGALVVSLVSSAPSIQVALVFLGGFSCLPILTTTLVSTLWGRTLGTTLRCGPEASGAPSSDRAWRSPQTLP